MPIIAIKPKTTAEASEEASAKLVKFDQDSIRSIRAMLAARVDAPQALKDIEALAIIERAKVTV